MSSPTSTSQLHRSVTIVLPVYNETHRAAPNVIALLDYVDTLPRDSGLIFVDDGSTDGTADLLEKLLAERDTSRCAQVLRRPHRGKGAATRSGILAATTDLIGFCDIDLATPLTSFTEIALAADRAPVLAIGSRDIVGSTVLRHESALRELLGRTYNRAVQWFVTPGLVDTQCGAKVARREIWTEILPASVEDGFAWDVEICGLALAAGRPVVEIAIEWVHDDGSNISVARDGLRMVAALPRIRRTTRRFASTHHRPGRSRRWQDRSRSALVVSVLRRFRAEPGPLIDLGGSGDVSARLGWDPRAVVVVGISPLRPALPVGFVAGTSDDPPVRPGTAAVVLTHSNATEATFGAAATLLRPGGLLVVVSPGVDPKWTNRQIRNTGLRIEHAGHAFVWLSPNSFERSPGRGALLFTAIERLVIGRLGARIPRGAATIVVARNNAARQEAAP